MQIESMMFVGWAAMPVVAYVVGRMAIRRSKRRTAERPQMDATTRVSELRRRRAEAGATRGRMAEAIRLAQGPVGPPLRRG
ncbi:hypothetical protein [Janibacter limosus]|uniref:hypothetical protein n=1 Tax=Janibacter limosus TaxID=53458 RepID=UPI0008340BF0|nr:hypothetical protein [Janibacter limosus]